MAAKIDVDSGVFREISVLFTNLSGQPERDLSFLRLEQKDETISHMDIIFCGDDPSSHFFNKALNLDLYLFC